MNISDTLTEIECPKCGETNDYENDIEDRPGESQVECKDCGKSFTLSVVATFQYWSES